MQLPKRIKVGPFIYSIFGWPNAPSSEDAQEPLEEQLGLCNNHNHTIHIRTDVAPALQAETLLHEVLHAVWSLHSMDSSRLTEESVVQRISAGLLTVMVDNPLFVDFILKQAEIIPNYEAS